MILEKMIRLERAVKLIIICFTDLYGKVEHNMSIEGIKV